MPHTETTRLRRSVFPIWFLFVGLVSYVFAESPSEASGPFNSNSILVFTTREFFFHTLKTAAVTFMVAWEVSVNSVIRELRKLSVLPDHRITGTYRNPDCGNPCLIGKD